MSITYIYYDSAKTRIQICEYRNAQGVLHRPWKEGPAVIEYFDTPDNHIAVETYIVNGKKHRPWKEGPAYIEYNIITNEIKYCPIFGADYIEYKKGNISIIKCCEYYNNGIMTDDFRNGLRYSPPVFEPWSLLKVLWIDDENARIEKRYISRLATYANYYPAWQNESYPYLTRVKIE